MAVLEVLPNPVGKRPGVTTTKVYYTHEPSDPPRGLVLERGMITECVLWEELFLHYQRVWSTIEGHSITAHSSKSKT